MPVLSQGYDICCPFIWLVWILVLSLVKICKKRTMSDIFFSKQRNKTSRKCGDFELDHQVTRLVSNIIRCRWKKLYLQYLIVFFVNFGIYLLDYFLKTSLMLPIFKDTVYLFYLKCYFFHTATCFFIIYILERFYAFKSRVMSLLDKHIWLTF